MSNQRYTPEFKDEAQARQSRAGRCVVYCEFHAVVTTTGANSKHYVFSGIDGFRIHDQTFME